MAVAIASPSAADLQRAAAAVVSFIDSTSPRRLTIALESWGCPPPFGRFLVGGASATADAEIQVVLHDSADRAPEPWPFRARVVERRGRWTVMSIVARCASCFGSGRLGIDDTEECQTCDGSGWGVRR